MRPHDGGSGVLDRLFAYDAENRLIAVDPSGDPTDGDVRLRFTYDHLGRRVRKLVEEYNAAQQQWQTVADVKFVYHGWRLLIERDGTNNDVVTHKYTWGLDLSGLVGPVSNRSSLDGAGGIGGLLATYDTQGTVTTSDDEKYLYFYDANGNVGQVVNYQATPTTFYWSTKAHYQYSPYGTVLSMTGDYAEENPFRFSTKYHDDETGFVYFGFRYYVPWLGRWLNRDPIGEEGGAHLYAFVEGRPVNGIDPFGHRPGFDLLPPLLRPSPLPLPPEYAPWTPPVPEPCPAPSPYLDPSLWTWAAPAAASSQVLVCGPFWCVIMGPGPEPQIVFGPQPDPLPEPLPHPPLRKYGPGYSAKRCDALYDQYKNACDGDVSCKKEKLTARVPRTECGELRHRFDRNLECLRRRYEWDQNCLGASGGYDINTLMRVLRGHIDQAGMALRRAEHCWERLFNECWCDHRELVPGPIDPTTFINSDRNDWLSKQVRDEYINEMYGISR